MSLAIQKEGQTLDILEDTERGVRLEVNRIGAEMISLCRRDAVGEWRGFLHRDGDCSKPVSGWANHATVMGYYIHRLWEGATVYRGVPMRGGNHGFLRHFPFDEPVRADGSSLTYSVPADRAPEEGYPLRVGFDLTYRLVEDGVRVEFRFHNEEPELSAHVSFGLHPGFAVTNVATARVLFPAGVYRRLWAPGNFLDGRIEGLGFLGGEMPYAKEALEGSYLLDLAEVQERTFVLEDPESRRRLAFDFSEVPYLTIWSDSSDFLCIEPCWGMPDSNPPVPFEDKVGIHEIPPGGGIEAGFSVHLGFLA